MDIHIENLGKRFVKEWIFKNFNYTFKSNTSYAITGANGSGKSTFLQIISGIIPATEGKVSYTLKGNIIEDADVYKHISIVAPYQNVIDEFSLEELFNFHFSFKSPINHDLKFVDWVEKINLANHSNKLISNFSSGMKQRVRLGLAFYTKSDLLLLDEPSNNLDAHGIDWYQKEIQNRLTNSTILICSNQRFEYSFCEEIINLNEWKK